MTQIYKKPLLQVFNVILTLIHVFTDIIISICKKKNSYTHRHISHLQM